MNIDKCTVEALRYLENKDYKSMKKDSKGVSKKVKIAMLAAAFTVLMMSASSAAYAFNGTPITDETVACAQVNDTYVYTRDYVNARRDSDFGNNVLFVVAPDTSMKLKGVDGDWAFVDINGVEAYVYTDYLSTEHVIYNGDCDKEDIEAAESIINSYVDTVSENETDNIYSGVDMLEDYINDEASEYDNDDENDVYSNNSGKFDAYSKEGYMTTEEFKNYGIVNHNGECFTYYSELVLPGGGLDIPGRYTDCEGYVCDGEGYVVLATPDEYIHPRGSIIELPTGRMGKFYDFCPEGSIDVYVNW